MPVPSLFRPAPLLGLALALAWSTNPCPLRADERPAALRALIQKYRCPIYDRLERIHDWGAPSIERDRFIVVSVPDGRYVQCMFHESARMAYCEAASGFYETKPGAPRTAHLPAAAIAGLARLGFSTDDSAGNFSLDRTIGPEPDYAALADLILAALHVAHGATADMQLRIIAPFAPGPASTCDPTS